MPRFNQVSCSQCGQTFGPGDHGYSSCQDHRGPVDIHIVLDRDGNVREQDGKQSFDAVVSDIIDGQYDNADKVIRIATRRAGWHHQTIEDITKNVAWAIFNKCDGNRNYIIYDTPAYRMVEQHVGIAQARSCIDPCTDLA